MAYIVQAQAYRHDIDGLRAIAVLAVIAFHYGLLPNGFLGVDIFFVISGYLITGLIYAEIKSNSFSIAAFYLRRTRRIIPLALFVSFVALVLGIVTMLPDDLENLAQSVFATNVFGNNILQAITTKNYWDVVNEYKPLMHTWSLGIEEQYYLLYPLLFMLVAVKKRAWILPILSALAAISFVLYLLPYEDYQKFYFIQFRFWELAIGGIAAILSENRVMHHRFQIILILLLLLLLCINESFGINSEIVLVLIVLLTVGILVTSNDSKLASFVLKNRLAIQVGKISFSLYMWHQLLLAYSRYFLFEKLHAQHLAIIFCLTVLLSVISRLVIEEPFRNRNKVNVKPLLAVLVSVFAATSVSSLYIHFNAGVLKNIPELGIIKLDIERGMHSKYNNRIHSYDSNFQGAGKKKILIIGNSFARDWANVLLESKYAKELDISYIYSPFEHKDFKARSAEADIIFYAGQRSEDIESLGLNIPKLRVVGVKNFGVSNGIFYNYRGADYYRQRASMESGYLEINEKMKRQWGGRYFDYIDKIIDSKNTVPVFTPTDQFISQDCRHLTQAGAKFFAELFDSDLAAIFNGRESPSQKPVV